MKEQHTKLEKFALKIAHGAGSPASVIGHTVFFLMCFGLILLGLDLEKVMLGLTTIVSLEAIYLSLFIQMTVNRQTKRIENVHDEIKDVQGNIEDLADQVEEQGEEFSK